MLIQVVRFLNVWPSKLKQKKLHCDNVYLLRRLHPWWCNSSVAGRLRWNINNYLSDISLNLAIIFKRSFPLDTKSSSRVTFSNMSDINPNVHAGRSMIVIKVPLEQVFSTPDSHFLPVVQIAEFRFREDNFRGFVSREIVPTTFARFNQRSSGGKGLCSWYLKWTIIHFRSDQITRTGVDWL